MSDSGTGSKPYTASNREIWGWGIGRIAEFSLVAIFGHAMTIFTVGFGLSPIIVGWCMMLPRLVDGIMDPIIGHWSDNTHTRWGRRKPFLIGGALAGACFLASLWWASPAWSSTTQFIYLSVIGMCLYLCYGTYAMAWNAVGMELSDDYHERSRIQAVSAYFVAGLSLANSGVYWLAMRPVFGNVIWGMRWVGGAMALLAVISAVVCTMMITERFTKANPRKQHVALLPAMKTTIRNRPFVVLLLMKVTEIFGGRLVGGMSFYLGVYYTCRGDQDLSSRIAFIAGALGTLWSFGALPFVKPASKWLGKRGALIAGASISFLGAILSPFITLPEHPYLGLIPGLVIAPLLVISSTLAGAILPDICDVDELQTGHRREGLFTSVMGFVSKLEISLAVLLVGYVVTWSSVDTTIGRRWEQLMDGKDAPVAGFAPGESSVFRWEPQGAAAQEKSYLGKLSEAVGSMWHPAQASGLERTFDRVSVLGEVRQVALAVSNESPTEGFHPVELRRSESNAGAAEAQWTFAPVTARYVRLKLLPEAGISGEKISLCEVRLSNGAGTENLLAAERGTKLAASQPPGRVANRLFWLVMIPGIVFAGLTLLMTVLFPLTEAKMKEVRRQLDERHRAEKAAEEAEARVQEGAAPAGV